MSFESVRKRMNGDLMEASKSEVKRLEIQAPGLVASLNQKIKDLEAELESIKDTPIYYKNVVLEGEVERLEAKLADISERAFNSEHEYKAKLAEAQAVYNSLIDCAARDTLKINELKAKIALLESDNNFSLGKRVVELVHEKFELEAKLDSYIKMRDELIEMNKIKEVKLEELTESAGDTVKSLSNHNVLLEAKLDQYRNSTSTFYQMITLLDDANTKIKELEAKYDTCTTHLVSYEATIGDLKAKLAEAEKEHI